MPHFPVLSCQRMLPAAVVLGGTLIASGGAGAEIFKKEDLLRGITITRAQCDATPQTFWLNAHGRDFCVRYYLSVAGGEGSRPVVFLQGDQLGKFNPKTMAWLDPSEAKDVDTGDIVEMADSFSKEAKTTAIYLARIGVDGTSGNHLWRKSVLELDLMNAALDALKARYGYEGFHLAGQSGGSKIAAGLIALRHDIACAVIGSGPLIAPDSRESKDPARNAFDLAQNIAVVAQNRALRPIVVGDKADKQVPVAQQSGYVDKLRKAGRPIQQLFVEAPETTDDKHHGVVGYTRLVTAGCVLGRSDDEIARAVGTLITRNIEHNQRRHKEAKDKAAILAAARQPVEGLAAETTGKK
jgi:pimeloyl-ACP methyl ester carboxylesterase